MCPTRHGRHPHLQQQPGIGQRCRRHHRRRRRPGRRPQARCERQLVVPGVQRRRSRDSAGHLEQHPFRLPGQQCRLRPVQPHHRGHRGAVRRTVQRAPEGTVLPHAGPAAADRRLRPDRESDQRDHPGHHVSPGPIRTELGGGLNDEFEALLSAQTALGRVGEPEDVASAIVSLLSEDNRWINAQSIEVAGGFVI
ncbi:MAG: short chain dehydrogenase family protein [Mycobacterium sp.]|nr:short chain dehydrogenase family protein [Mycobacterium sp.]